MTFAQDQDIVLPTAKLGEPPLLNCSSRARFLLQDGGGKAFLELKEQML